LALVSYLVLHVIASRPLTPVTAPGQMGDMVVKGMATTLAMFGQYILPFALGIAALVSGVNLIRQKKLRIYGVRLDFLLFAATFFPILYKISVFVNPSTTGKGNLRNGGRCLDLKRSFASACRKVGIKDFHFHDLRHTFASQIVMNGVDITTVSKLLGHATLTMTLRYTHLAPAHLKSAVDVLSRISSLQTKG